MIRILLPVLLCVLCCTASNYAQSNIWGGLDTLIKFEIMEIGRDDGLLHSANLKSIVEDSSGVLYMATWEGLYRYNGYHAQRLFEHFEFEHRKLFSTLSCYIIYDDHRGHLWCFTDEGVYCMTKNTYEMKEVFVAQDNADNWQHRFEAVTEIDGKLYAGSRNGMHVFDLNNQTYIKSYFINQGFFSDTEPKGWANPALPHSSPDSIWIGCLDGMRATHIENDGYRLVKADLGYGEHHFHLGGFRKDSFFISGLYNNGLSFFNFISGEFQLYPTHDFERTKRPEDNRITSMVPLNDSIVLIHGEHQHAGLLHLYRKAFKWIQAFPQEFRSGFVYSKDDQGYIWTAWWGRLHRSSKPLLSAAVPLQPIIDVSEVRSNGQVVGEPYLNGYAPIKLLDYHRSATVVFSVTRPDLCDDLQYDYRVNTGPWQEHTDNENVIGIPGLKAGKNALHIRAIDGDELVAERVITIHRFVPIYQRWFFFPLLSVLFALGVLGLYFYRMREMKRREKLEKEYEIKLARVEGEALRSQINPHFIFNTLNSIKLYTLKKSPQEAGVFITKFSTLIRNILENSRHNLISLSQEIRTLVGYIEIENMRFRNSFEFDLEIDERIDTEFFKVPPMVLQPFIENAIWHGLQHKEGQGRLSLRFNFQSDEYVICEIQDNGIGRDQSKKMRSTKLKKQSLGLKITKERLEHLNEAEGMKNYYEVIDLYGNDGSPAGTLVRVHFVYA